MRRLTFDRFQFGGTKLRKKLVSLIAALAGLVLVGSEPKLELSWKNPGNTATGFKNIMVLALNGKGANRAEFEDELVAAISRPGRQAAPSYEFIPRPDATPIDMNNLRGIIKDQNFDAILAARLVKRDEKTTYVPGVVYTPFPFYRTFYGYYGAVYPLVYAPGYMETEKQAQVEVNFYSTAKPDGELVWTGTTNVFESSSAMNVIKDLVKIVTKELEKENIIARPSK
jgi:hypothetical protein